MTTIVTIDMGGTGATHAAGAREALSVPSMTDMGQSYAQANSARDQANTARGNANDAYSQANTAYSQSNSARDQANTAYADANTRVLKSGDTMTGQLNISSGGLLVSGNVNVRSSGATNGLVFIDTVNNRLGIGLNVAPYQFLSTLHVYGDANITNGIVTSNINVTTVNTTTINASTVLTNSGINVSAQAADAYVQANTARGTANDAYGAANTKLASAGGTLSGDLIITGNLTVSGNQTILNTEVLTTEDADIILLSNTSSTPALNAGLIINRGTSTNTFLRWDEATDKWGWSDSGTTTYYFEDLRQGLSTTNTTFGTINTSLGTINTNYQAAYSQANTAGTNSLNAYGQANTARDTANSAYGAANNRVLKAGDTMTGQLNISSGGLLVTGNVGFGTASPSAKLHILTGSNKNILFKDASHTTLTTDLGSAITFSRPSDGSNDLSGIFSWNNGGLVLSSRNEMIFATGGTGSYSNSIETMRITRNDAGTGNVGIGTASPIFPLQVKTNTGTPPQALQLNTTDWTTTIGSAFQFGFGAATGNTYSEIRALSGGYNAWNNLVLQSGGGNVGIGTASPGAKLEVSGQDSSGTIIVSGDGGSNGVRLNLKSTAANGRQWMLMSGGTSHGGAGVFNIRDGTDGYNRLTIDSSGNIGIGTTSPAERLHVSGTIQIDGTTNGIRIFKNGSNSINSHLYIANAANNRAYNWQLNSDGSALDFWAYNGSSWNNGITYTASGNVGIGTTSPATKLNVLVGAGTANGTAGIRIGGVGNYESLELGILDSYGAMFRSYGNDMHYYSGHWRTVGTGASEDHAHYWYTSKSGSANWSTAKLILDADGALKPGADNTYNLGTSSLRWANIYTADLNMSNKGSQNDIDGTWGEWTIQEGEEDLFLLNRRNGKKFKFLLKEIE